MRKTWLIAAIAASLFVTLSFLSAAAFVAVLDRYGLIYACLSGAGIFFLVMLASLICYAASDRRKPAPQVERPEREEKSILETTLANPMMMAAGMQVVRAIGVKRLLPILAVAGIALGYFVARGNNSAGEPDEGVDAGD
jgi:threonine/homoserine/homoserine lactone efflux protein